MQSYNILTVLEEISSIFLSAWQKYVNFAVCKNKRLMGNRILQIILTGLLLTSAPALLRAQDAASRPLMRDVFAAMPDSLLPAISKNNRLDCIDFIENGLEAKVRNAFDDYVKLEALTPDYARFRTSAASVMEFKLLPQADTTSLLCIVTTVECGEKDTPSRIEDSALRLLNADWSPASADVLGSAASVSSCIDGLEFFTDEVPDSLRTHYEQAKASAADFHPVRMHLSADDVTLTLDLQTGQLDVDEKRALEGRLRTITMKWDGRNFVRQ